MLSPHIVSALLAQREADLQRRAELARLRHREPEPELPTTPTGSRRTAGRRRRRRHLRLV